MRIFTSIRWRLQLWYGALLLAVLVGFGITVFQMEKSRQMQRLDADLHDRLPVLVDSQRPGPQWDRRGRRFHLDPEDALWFDQPRNGSIYYVVWLHDSATPVTYSKSAPENVPRPRPSDPTHRSRGALRETFVFPEPGDCILVGRDLTRELTGLHQLRWRLATIGAQVMGFALVVGGWLVSRALRPIDVIAATAGRIATGDLSQRIEVSDSKSELGRLAMVLNSTFSRLESAFSQQARFTADAAHELRTPVSVLLSHSQNGLACSCHVQEHRDAFAASQRAAPRMRRLIEALLELARLDAGQEEFQKEPIDLADLARDTVEMLRPMADEQKISIHLDSSTARTIGDSERLGQVALNLVNNAILHHHKTGGKVMVMTRMDKDVACLSVIDNGPGIAAESLPHLFERFFRGDASRNRSTGGTGLGLAISKAIVESHGGLIDVQSEMGKGTTVTIRLPAGKM